MKQPCLHSNQKSHYTFKAGTVETVETCRDYKAIFATHHISLKQLITELGTTSKKAYRKKHSKNFLNSLSDNTPSCNEKGSVVNKYAFCLLSLCPNFHDAT